MATLLFKLNGVTEEEAEFVRNALNEAGVNYYETSQGRWGVSLAAIWLNNDNDYNEARALVDKIQQDWLEHVRQHPVPTMAERFSDRPASVILTLVAVAIIFALSVLPFLGVFE